MGDEMRRFEVDRTGEAVGIGLAADTTYQIQSSQLAVVSDADGVNDTVDFGGGVTWRIADIKLSTAENLLSCCNACRNIANDIEWRVAA